MAEFPRNSVIKAQSWLLKSGMSTKDPDLYQILNVLISAILQSNLATETAIADSGGGGSANAIDALIDDVVATGPGTVSATIQPNVVSYSKIQQVTALRLLGNPNGALQDVVEIPLGDNLAFVGGALEVQIEPGTGGLLHRVLSSTHYDSIPAAPVYGDIIYATVGPALVGAYYGAVILALVVEDFSGVRVGYTSGFHGAFTPSYSMAYAPPDIDMVAVTPPDNWLAWEYIDCFILAPVVEDFSGVRAGYTVPTYVAGNNAGYYAFTDLAIIATPSPANADIGALWTRKAIGSTGQVLTVSGGIPVWQNLPSIPAEPSYPWTDVAYNAANFTATGGVTPAWTVAAGDVTRFQYQQFPGSGGLNNNVRISILLETTSVSGSAPTQLQITLPFNILGRFGQYISMLEAGPTTPVVSVIYDAGLATNKLFIQKIGGAAFDTTADSTYLSLEISAVLAP